VPHPSFRAPVRVTGGCKWSWGSGLLDLLNDDKKDEILSDEIEFGLALVSPVAPARRSSRRAVSRFRRIWPVAGLAIALIVNVAWIGLLGFEFFKLIEAAFL
jgi:hypothetical protein